MKDICDICESSQPLSHVNLYVNGSEGINICESCQIKICNHVRDLISLKNYVKIKIIKQEWIKNDDKKLLFKACGLAQKAVNYLTPDTNEITPEPEPEKPTVSIEPKPENEPENKPEPEIIEPKPTQDNLRIVEIAKVKKHVVNMNKVFSKNCSVEILKNVKIKGTKNNVELQVTNLDEVFTLNIKSDNKREFEILVDYAKFSQAIKSIKRKYISFDKTDNQDYYCITPSESDMDEYPELSFENCEVTSEFEVSKELASDIAYAYKFVSKDASRRVLHGVYIDEENIVGTDGKRIFYKAHNLAIKEPMIIPVTKLMKSIKGDFKIETLKSHCEQIRITTPEYVYVCRLIDGHYPNYKQVIPASFMTSVKLNRCQIAELQDLIKADDTGEYNENWLEINFRPNKVTCKFSKGETPIEFETNSVYVCSMSLNGKFLNDFLNYGNTDLYLHFNDGWHLVGISTSKSINNIFGVIMPMRNK